MNKEANMFKKALILLLFPLSLFSQRVIGTYNLKNKPTEFVYKVSRPQKPVKLFFQNDSEYEIITFDSTFQNTKSLVYNNPIARNRYVNFLESDSLISLYFLNIKSGEFSVLSSSGGQNFNYQKLFKENDKEHFLKAVQVKDKMCALSIIDTSNHLIVRSYDHFKLAGTDTFKIEFPMLITALKTELNLLNQEPFSDIGITYINYELEQQLSDIYTDRKLYVRDDKLVMIFDRNNTSHIVIADLTKKKSYYKKFSFKLELETSPQTTKGNSYLFQDNFFRVTSNGHQLNLAIIDFRNFKLIRNHNIFDDMPIEIKNGPILFEESSNGSVPTIEPVKNTEKFFKIIRGADLGVTARQLSNNAYELTIGSHQSEIYVSQAMGPTIGMGMGMGVGMGIGAMGVGIGSGAFDPFYYPYGISNRGYSVSIEKAYFHSVLSEKEFAHVPMSLQTNYHNRKNLFWARNFKNGKIPEVSAEYAFKDKVHYGYWDRKISKFTLLEFEK
ncbi:MAG: hypothetical protein H7329_20105 [Opitutaceae bacterium]|nr:hypothetical protein [Cytophagales bacterium]